MSFWESEIGEVTGNAEDAFAKSFTQIPDGTMALARVESFKNAEFNGNKYLSISWLLTDGDFKGSKVEQKLKVYGDPMAKEPAKARHRALNMLKLIYQLYNTKPKHAGEPTDQDLAVFVGKAAGIKIRETEPNDQGRQYNWVAEIHDSKGFKCETGHGLPATTHVAVATYASGGREPIDSAFSRNQAAAPTQDLLDDVPF
jgi:hypothetical protein